MQAYVGLLALVAVAYAVALDGPYQFDDYATLAVDPGAASLASWWDHAHSHVRPLTKLTFVLTHRLGEALGDLPLGHRLGNVAIHLAAVALLAGVVLAWSRTCAPRLSAAHAGRAAWLAAAAFGLHPLTTEAVSYLSGRSMSLGTALSLAGLSAWIGGRVAGSAARLAWSLLLFAAAALARETTAFSVPLVVLSWEWVRRDAATPAFSLRRAAVAIRATMVLGALAGATLAWMCWHDRYAALLQMSSWISRARAGDASLLAALSYLGAAAVLLRYPNIDPTVDATLGPTARLFGAAVIAGSLWLAWRARTTHPQWIFGALWVLAWVLPLYAVPIRHDAVSERHFYPVLCGLALAAAIRLTPALEDGRKPIVARALCAAVLLVFAAVTVVRNADYRTEIALWEAARRGSPDKVRVLNNLGVAYMEAGRWNEATAVLERGLALEPGDSTMRWNLRAARARDLRVLRLPAVIE